MRSAVDPNLSAITSPRDDKCALAVLISGDGTNLQAILDAIDANRLRAKIRVVISNRANVQGLQRARDAGIPAEVLEPAAYTQRELYDATLVSIVEPYKPDLIVLAGFMRILTTAFLAHFPGRILNVHPSLLPRYRGLNTHRRVLEAGDRVHGASIHVVTEKLDDGPVLLQARVPVIRGDTELTLSARVQGVEHKIYPRAIGWFAEGRLRLRDGIAWLDGTPLYCPIVFDGED